MASYNVDLEIEKLEKGFSVPGTMLVRTLCAVGILKKQGLKVIPDRESMLVWSLGVGPLLEPKMFFYDYSIPGAIKRAQKALRSLKRRV